MKKRLLVSLAALALIGWVLWLVKKDGTGDPESGGTDRSRPEPPVAGRPAAVGGKSAAVPDARTTAAHGDEIASLLDRALTAMRRGRQEEVDQVLAELDRRLAAGRGDAEAGIAAILEFLRSGQDAPTGRGFVIGEGGILAEAATLRVYLMDRLGTLSREAGSGAALEMARETLQAFGSADEWAVSMRNVAWFDPASRGFLQDRVEAMLGHREWRDRPTAGMLEAFDVIVHTGAMAVVPELGRLVSEPDSPLARASGVALDRLSAGSALELTALLNQQPELLATVPMKRADLFAHADLAVPDERRQLETYLLRPDVSARERKKFFSSLIQTGRFVSHNLITPYVPPETPDQAAARLETLTRTVNEWLRDDRFSALTGELATLGATVNEIIDEIAADEEESR